MKLLRPLPLKHLLLIIIGLFSGALVALGQNTGTGNWYGIAIKQGAYTATKNSSDITNNNYRGIHLLINVTSYTSGSWTPHIQGKDPASGIYYDILVGAAISSAGFNALKIYPGIVASPNVSVSDFLPRVWRVSMVGTTTPIASFSVSYFSDQ